MQYKKDCFKINAMHLKNYYMIYVNDKLFLNVFTMQEWKDEHY